MSFDRRLRSILPYMVVLVAAVFMYGVADRIAYTPMPGQIGPDSWPKIILILLVVVCIVEMLRQVFLPARLAEIPEVIVAPNDPSDGPIEEEEDHPWLVLSVGAATVVYLLLLETGGFFLCTVLYSTILIWTAGLRRPIPAAGFGLAMTLFFTFTFMKIVFVALPIGIPPFSAVSLGVMTLLGVH